MQKEDNLKRFVEKYLLVPFKKNICFITTIAFIAVVVLGYLVGIILTATSSGCDDLKQSIIYSVMLMASMLALVFNFGLSVFYIKRQPVYAFVSGTLYLSLLIEFSFFFFPAAPEAGNIKTIYKVVETLQLYFSKCF